MAASEISIANLTNFQKIQNIFNDETKYKEILENSETFNQRLCIERRLRMPFLDPQTGVAQNHCDLFMKSSQRLPGFREGQIYTYPSKRWQKPKRQYLLHHQSYKAYQFREKTYLQHHFSGENSGKCKGWIYWLLFCSTSSLVVCLLFFREELVFLGGFMLCLVFLRLDLTCVWINWPWETSYPRNFKLDCKYWFCSFFACSEHRLQWQQFSWD